MNLKKTLNARMKNHLQLNDGRIEGRKTFIANLQLILPRSRRWTQTDAHGSTAQMTSHELLLR